MRTTSERSRKRADRLVLSLVLLIGAIATGFIASTEDGPSSTVLYGVFLVLLVASAVAGAWRRRPPV